MRSLRTKYTLFVLGCLLVASLAIGGFCIYSAHKNSSEEATAYMSILGDMEVNALDADMFRIEQSVEVGRQFVLNYLTEQEDNAEFYSEYSDNLMKMLESIVKSSSGAQAVYVRIKPDEQKGKTRGVTLVKKESTGEFVRVPQTELTGFNVQGETYDAWYYEPLRVGHALWIGPYYDKKCGGNVLSYVIPIYKDGITVGVIGMDIGMSQLCKYIDGVKVYDSGYAVLCDDSGNILYHREYSQGVVASAISGNLKAMMDAVNADDSDSRLVLYTYNGEKQRLIVKKLHNNLILVLTAPASEIFANLNSMMSRLLIVFILVLILGGIVVTRAVKLLVQPIRQLTFAAKRIASGDLSVKIDYESKDEIGVLAQSFRDTSEELKRRIDYINRLAYIDVTTGTGSKSAYNEEIKKVAMEIATGQANFSVVVFDVNNLKKVNDILGHEMGDHLIQDAAKLIQEAFWGCGIFRIGGDEFAVIVNDEMQKKASDMMHSFEYKMKMLNEKQREYGAELQVAAGMATYEKDKDMTFADVFRRADQIMYENKAEIKRRSGVNIIAKPVESDSGNDNDSNKKNE